MKDKKAWVIISAKEKMVMWVSLSEKDAYDWIETLRKADIGSDGEYIIEMVGIV